ncbi:poly(U)-specific endoribonuclease-like isoform X1 [Meleagris gallopavo]|uniref:poly(U)-specific endoribonuclease-like isoform X1 n=1 Tax=Meleagris gallopavo TaxID=9103 RepID=UPI000549A218|nr:poly(U)-specific endoribonuclease-like isoform X1 [Meleagris gallopavo]
MYEETMSLCCPSWCYWSSQSPADKIRSTVGTGSDFLVCVCVWQSRHRTWRCGCTPCFLLGFGTSYLVFLSDWRGRKAAPVPGLLEGLLSSSLHFPCSVWCYKKNFCLAWLIAFISLLGNYETSTGVEEVVTPEEIAENNCFLDAILMTGVMKLAHEYLLKKKLAKPNLVDFKYQLYDIWFQLYPRKEGDRPDSCGFEHVFVGETRLGKQILGLHNWVQFYLQEKHKQIDYKGYITQKNKTRPYRDDQVLSIQFSWKGSVKPIGSTFIGVSPEFEFALYTVIFLLSEERVTRETVKIEEYELQIVVCRHGRHIGTAYPVLLNTNNED